MPVPRKRLQLPLGLLLLMVVGWSGYSTLAADRELQAHQRAVAARQAPSYPLEICLVTGDPLEPSTWVEVVVEERLVRLASGAAADEVLRNPSPWLVALDKAVVARESAEYPLDTCVVCDEPLDADGEVVDCVYGTRLLRCCQPDCCVEAHSRPQPALAKVDAAYAAAQRATYPLDTCLVTGLVLGPDAVEHIHGTTLGRLANDAAREAFLLEPRQYLLELEWRGSSTPFVDGPGEVDGR